MARWIRKGILYSCIHICKYVCAHLVNIYIWNGFMVVEDSYHPTKNNPYRPTTSYHEVFPSANNCKSILAEIVFTYFMVWKREAEIAKHLFQTTLLKIIGNLFFVIKTHIIFNF